MKRLLSAMLALCLLLPSCAGGQEEPESPAQQSAAPSAQEVPAAETEPEETERVLWENLPEMTLDGYEFRFLESPRWADTGATVPHGNVEELNGEAINDALYNRNRAVEAKFDTVITTNVDSSVTGIITKSGNPGTTCIPPP